MNHQKLELAFKFHQDGFFDNAWRVYQEILHSDPCNFDALHLSGLVAYQRLDLKSAEQFFLNAICVNWSNADVHLNLGAMLMAAGRVDEALVRYDCVIAIQPDYANAYYNRAMALQENQKLEKCLVDYDRAISINSNFADAFNNRGNALNGLNLFHEALISFETAMILAPNSAQVYYNAAISLQKLIRFDKALVMLDQAILIKSDYSDCYNSQGIVFTQMRRFDKAIDSLEVAISINPDFAPAFNHRGMVFYQLHSYAEALLDFEKSISLKTDYADAFYNRGLALQELGRWDEASISLDKALSMKADYSDLFGMALHLRLKISDWSGLNDQLDKIKADTLEKKSVTTPFIALSIYDDPAFHYVAARQHLQKKFPMRRREKIPVHIKKSSKIRLAYFSADFRMHPMSQLISGVFDRHDRDKFELIAFSFGPDAPNEMRTRIKGACDQFIDVRVFNDEEIRDTALKMEIDIAVDLMGFTANSRTGIFSSRCAPVQLSFLGYPGTMAAEYIDYIVADTIVAPPQTRQFYQEKILYLPGSYFPSSYKTDEAKGRLPIKEFTRDDLGLPTHRFVFCCFNNSFKILPSVFDRWMRILSAVEGSVLWLLDDNAASNRNLQREAIARGVSADRLFFARRMPLADHLARHRCADLFLDTLPYNAHTTATDALWAGLPVLTRIGESFAGRVAASLLNAVGLPELVTTSDDAYEQLAVRLATHPDELNALKQKLAANILSCRLFDTGSYVRSLEAAYTTIHERHQAGLKPDHIYVED